MDNSIITPALQRAIDEAINKAIERIERSIRGAPIPGPIVAAAENISQGLSPLNVNVLNGSVIPSLRIRIIELSPIRNVVFRRGGSGTVFNCMASNGTDTVRITAWNSEAERLGGLVLGEVFFF